MLLKQLRDTGYYFDTAGNVYSDHLRGSKIGSRMEKPRRLTPGTNIAGYRVIAIAGKTILVHSAMLTVFVGPRPRGMYACHNNGNPADNRLSNLRWDTPASNVYDRKTHGTDNSGSRHGMAKLKESDIIHIRDMAKRQSLRSIAKELGMAHQTISGIVRGKNWKHVQ